MVGIINPKRKCNYRDSIFLPVDGENNFETFETYLTNSYILTVRIRNGNSAE